MKPVVHKFGNPETKIFAMDYLNDPFFDTKEPLHFEYQLFEVPEDTRFIGDSIDHTRKATWC